MPTSPAISACSRRTTRSNSPNSPNRWTSTTTGPCRKRQTGPAGWHSLPGCGLLLGSTLSCALAALTLLASPLVFDALPVLAVSCLAGILLLAAAGFAATLLLVQARAGEMHALPWPQPALAIGAGLLVGAIVLGAWHTPAPSSPDMLLAGRRRHDAAGVSRSGAGALLGRYPRHRACRGGRTCCVIASGPAGADRPGAGVDAARLAHFRSLLCWFPLCAALVLLLAAEFILRGVAALFLPTPASSVARPAASSAGGRLHSTAAAPSCRGQSSGHAAMGDRSFTKLGARFCRPRAPADRSAAGAADVGTYRSRGAAAGPASGLRAVRPPDRSARTWPAFDSALAAWCCRGAWNGGFSTN